MTLKVSLCLVCLAILYVIRWVAWNLKLSQDQCFCFCRFSIQVVLSRRSMLTCCSSKFSRFFWTPLLGPQNKRQLWSLAVTDADNVVTAVACYARRYNEQLFEQKHSLSPVNRALGRISSTCLSLYLSSSFIHIYQPDFHCICLFLLFTFVNMIVHVFVLFIYSHLSTWLSLYLSCSLSRLRMNAACHQSCPLLSPRSPARAASQAHCRPTS